MKIIGVIGYKGSGKSTVCREFTKLGAHYIDADSVVHELYETGESGARKIQLFFGDEYLLKNGNVNRRKLGKVVFDDSRKLKILNNLIHPLVSSEIEKRLHQVNNDFCVIEAISFEQKNLGRLVDMLIWIERDCDLQNQKFLNLQKRPEKVDFVLNNNCSKAELKIRIKKLWQKVTSQ